MNRFTAFLAPIILLACLSACHKDSTPVGPALSIVGKWTLKQQHFTEYVNDVKAIDTILSASDTSNSNVQFNADKTFTSESIKTFNTGLNREVAEAKTTGTYTFTNSAITTSTGMTGFYTEIVNWTVLTMFSNYAYSSALNSISAKSLGLHTENSYTATQNSVSTNYKIVNDYTYSK